MGVNLSSDFSSLNHSRLGSSLASDLWNSTHGKIVTDSFLWEICSVNELATPGTSRVPKTRPGSQDSQRFHTHEKLHDLFKMTGTHPLFDISGSYVEVDGWVSLKLSNHATLFGSLVSRIVVVFYDSSNNEYDSTILTPNRLSST
jgi:hypothetical protein